MSDADFDGLQKYLDRIADGIRANVPFENRAGRSRLSPPHLGALQLPVHVPVARPGHSAPCSPSLACYANRRPQTLSEVVLPHEEILNAMRARSKPDLVRIVREHLMKSYQDFMEPGARIAGPALSSGVREKSMPELNGIIPALITPVTPEGEVAPKVLEQLLERTCTPPALPECTSAARPARGLLQTVAMRKTVAEVVARSTPAGKANIIHIGAHRPDDAVELARHARRIGAHAVSSLPPIGGYSFEEVRAYYQRIAAAADLPVLVYYFPEVSSAIRTVDQILELCAIPGVIGLKFTDFDLYRMSRLTLLGHKSTQWP